jgi:ubiquinone/menaquinone biosynthesis C-methylase UbiE
MPTARSALQEEYGRLAPRYEERWAVYVRRTTERTLAQLAPRPGERILDVGCGTGALIRAVLRAQPRAHVMGVDLSPAMLEIARSGSGSLAALVVADAASLPLPDGSFDAVVSVSSFHFWADAPRALRELARIIRPGGRLVVTDWCDDFVACRVCDRWLRLARSAHQRIYGTEECRQLAEAAGFAVERLDRYKVSWLWGMMTLVARKR